MNNTIGGHEKNSDGIWKVNASSQKQETVGSLSFNVIDASARGVADQRPIKSVQEDAGSSAKASVQMKAPSKKPATRTKVPFEKGYSQMDWLKLTRTHPDLAGWLPLRRYLIERSVFYEISFGAEERTLIVFYCICFYSGEVSFNH